jgi:poly-beta-1,6-N-acetyl-D-glucosamine N-deacetylase
MDKLVKKYSLWLIAINILLIACLALYLMLGYRPFTVPVFAFHNIVDLQADTQKVRELSSRAKYLDYTLANLDRLVTYLLDNNYWFLDSQELYDYFIIKSKQIPEQYLNSKPVVLTFDDGYKSVDIYILPWLQALEKKYRQKIKIVLFINPKYVTEPDKKIKYLKCSDLQKGLQQGFYDVQSHSFNHIDLTKLNPTKLEAELKDSQQFLRQCLQNIPGNADVAKHFAFPYDRTNNSVEAHTARYYLSAYKFNGRFRNLLFWHNSYTIPRIGVNARDTPEKLIKLIE